MNTLLTNRATVAGVALLTLVGCSTPSFIRLPGAKETPAAAPETVNIDMEVTPRELLTARLINPPADENTPRITVGKLIEFADRYLSCDCSGTRFVKSWERRDGNYILRTNSSRIRPLNFACRTEEDSTDCFLTEIDRGPQVEKLKDRFVPGSDFIGFMYENGLKCDRDGPCPAADPAD